MGKVGRQRVEKQFTFARMADEYGQLFNRLGLGPLPTAADRRLERLTEHVNPSRVAPASSGAKEREVLVSAT
jgi:hypothetical protein